MKGDGCIPIIAQRDFLAIDASIRQHLKTKKKKKWSAVWVVFKKVF